MHLWVVLRREASSVQNPAGGHPQSRLGVSCGSRRSPLLTPLRSLRGLASAGSVCRKVIMCASGGRRQRRNSVLRRLDVLKGFPKGLASGIEGLPGLFHSGDSLVVAAAHPRSVRATDGFVTSINGPGGLWRNWRGKEAEPHERRNSLASGCVGLRRWRRWPERTAESWNFSSGVLLIYKPK